MKSRHLRIVPAVSLKDAPASSIGARVITTRSGVQIGSTFIPKPPMPSDDAERLQRALLDPLPERRPGIGRWLAVSAFALLFLYLITARAA